MPSGSSLSRSRSLSLSLALSLSLSLTPHTALAQRSYNTGPSVWFSGSIGYLDPQGMYDGTTATYWDFGSGIGYRASMEYSVGAGSSVGIEGSFSRMPLVYSGGATCDGCSAHADILGAMAKFHMGGGGSQPFFQTFDLSAGVVEFTNFRADAGKVTLAPKKDPDFAFAFGYGFGYALDPGTQLFMSAEYVSTLHQRTGLQSNESALHQQYTVRAGMRFGLGQRSAVR